MTERLTDEQVADDLAQARVVVAHPSGWGDEHKTLARLALALQERLQAAEARVKDLEAVAETDVAHRASLEALDRQIAAEERATAAEAERDEARRAEATQVLRRQEDHAAYEAERESDITRARREAFGEAAGVADSGECGCESREITRGSSCVHYCIAQAIRALAEVER